MGWLKSMNARKIASLFSASAPGPTRIANGSVPADPSFRRLPLLVWGDVFPNGDRPQVRRVLAGADAHECMYAWVYLNELLMARDMLRGAMNNAYEPFDRFDALKARFEGLRNETSDPQSQASDDLIERFLPTAIFLKLAGEDATEFCELGSTLFASIEKIDLCGRIAGMPLERSALQFSGIEYSPFLRRASVSLHPDDRISLVPSSDEWRRSRPHVFQLSRFVGSYAFRGTAALVDQLGKCDAFHLTDVFNLEDQDFHSWDLGLPITFMSFAALVRGLADIDFDLFLTGVDPEYHSAGRKKAAVARLFGIRRPVAERIRFFEHFAQCGGFASATNAKPLSRESGAAVMAAVDGALSSDEWEAFAEYKRLFPIWGPPQNLSKEQIRDLVSSRDLAVDLEFDSYQAAAVVKATLRSGKWSPELQKES